jgi:NAD-dependent histone deacetylase SIR2
MIGETESFDISKSPDMLLIMGTSLKVHGLKALVKDFAKTVHATKVGKSSSGKIGNQHGIVVYVNKTPPSREWTDYIDVYIQGETDAWVKKAEADWRAARPADWEVQSKLAVSEMQEKSSTRTAAKGEFSHWDGVPRPRTAF